MSERSSRYWEPPGSTFRVGAVFSRTFEVLRRHFGRLFVLTAVPSLVYFGILFLLGLVFGPPFRQAAVGAFARGFSLSIVVWILATGALTISQYVITHAILLSGVFDALRGRTPAIGASFQRGLARFLPLIGLSLLAGLVIGVVTFVSILVLGFLVSGMRSPPVAIAAVAVGLVPMLILLIRWYVAFASCVVERLGAVASLSRSAELTRGCRWRIFAVLVVVVVATVVGSYLIIRWGIAVRGGLVLQVVNFLWQTLSTTVSGALATVVYHELRVAKEGIDIERITSVFD